MGVKQTRHGLRLLTNIVGAFVARGINLVSTFLTVPLAVAGLGVHDYGIFAVILSAATFVAYADFGMGLAMVNPITASETAGDHAETRRLIGETWSLLLIIAVAVLVLGLALVGTLALLRVIGADHMLAWLMCIVGVALGLPAAITQRVLFALQRNYEANLWMSAAKIASLGGCYVAYQLGAGLATYVFAMLWIPALFGWLNTTWLFRFNRPELAPGVRPSASAMRRLLPEGLRYTVLQIGPYIETGFDIMLIGLALGPLVTTSYDLVSRLFNYVPALAAVGVIPLWPAIAAARARGDRQWVKRIESIATLLLCSVAAVMVTGLAIYYREIIQLWTGQSVSFSPTLVACVAAASGFSAVAALLASILVGHQQVKAVFRIQIITISILAVAKVMTVVPLGLPSLAAANALALLVKTSWLLILLWFIRKNDAQRGVQ